VQFDPSIYKVVQSVSQNGTRFRAIKYEDVLEIKIPESEEDAEKKIKALEKWLFPERSEDEGIVLDEEGSWWVSQLNESLFGKETCWSQQCCYRAANEILSNAGTSTNRTQQIVIAENINVDCGGILKLPQKIKTTYESKNPLTFTENFYPSGCQMKIFMYIWATL
jgi:hypothetical protein